MACSRVLINAGLNVLQPMLDADEAFRMADHQVTAGSQALGQSLNKLRLRFAIKIDHHVPAKDDVKTGCERITRLKKIQ